MRSSSKRNRPDTGRLCAMYRPCAGIIQIRFNGSAAHSRHLSPVTTELPDKMSASQSNVVMATQGVNTMRQELKQPHSSLSPDPS
jgi:hypothetical protein